MEKKILVVDDEPWNIKVMEGYLSVQGYDVIAVSSGKAALAIMREQQIDLVLLDIMMPVMDGYDVCREIKASEATRSIPVILVTALRETIDKVTGLDAGAADFLTKPVNKAELSARVRAHLRIKALTDELQEWNETLERKVEERTREIQEKNTQLAESYQMILESLATSLDVREHETGKHSLRVAFFTVELARKIGIQGTELEEIAMGALLHDIGKIGTPDSILLKPGKLTDEEWVEMRKHPETGWKMIEKVEFIGVGRDLVLSHQERFDGNGYPRKLSGGDIYIGARCFCMADTLDAMLSKRPYKEALPYETVASEVERCSGTQFDPNLVKVFLEIPKERWTELKADAESGNVRTLMQSIRHPESIL